MQVGDFVMHQGKRWRVEEVVDRKQGVVLITRWFMTKLATFNQISAVPERRKDRLRL